ncbi:Hypothetical protein PHPALM_15100 [Phytophthora palmivora]|uniref:Uncharacterized protein n=1 Tax=Phytophthora palmivora TaxID=4796 RepID=A0A2P4XT29_9STRA|nr:Hypothetical protein PHPALM_15100 [Phytophthora palmivora]
MVRRHSESNSPPESPQRSVAFSGGFPLPFPGTPPSAKRRPLQTQHLGVAAIDAGYCCHEQTQLHLNVEWRLDRHVVGGTLENATGQVLFEVREKPLSLHRQRSLLDVTEVPVATKRSVAFSGGFPLPFPGTPPSAKRRPLQTQHLGVAAIDAGYCCHEQTQLHLNVEWRLDRHVVGGTLENATGQVLFEVREKTLSLHRQRSLLDVTEVPVATIRMSAFRRRKVTYSVFPRAEASKKPLFKFTMSRSKLEMTFTDIMTGDTCRLGSDGELGDIEIWMQRGLSANATKQPIAHMYPAPAGTPLGYSLDIAKGVDAVMVILVGIAVHDSEPDHKMSMPSMF